jgi:hypothetical protein
VRDITAAALAIGLFSGAVFAASDLLMNRATASTAQCAQLILVMSAVGALLGAPVITLFILIGRRIPFLPAEPALLAFSAGLLCYSYFELVLYRGTGDVFIGSLGHELGELWFVLITAEFLRRTFPPERRLPEAAVAGVAAG